MAEAQEAGQRLEEGAHAAHYLLAATAFASEAIESERTALLANGETESSTEEVALIEAAEKRKSFWNYLFCYGLWLGFPLFGVSLLLFCLYLKTVYIVLFVISVVVLITGGLSGGMVLQVAQKLKKDLRMRRCKTGGYLLKSTIPEDQWIRFHYFDSKHRIQSAFWKLLLLFVVFAGGTCLMMFLASIGDHLQKILYAYVSLGCLGFFGSIFLIIAGYTLIRRARLMKETDRDVFLFNDSAIYNGFFLDWNTVRGSNLQTGVLYLESRKFVRDEAAGNMIRIDVFSVDSKNNRNEKTFYIPIAESDAVAAQVVLGSIV